MKLRLINARLTIVSIALLFTVVSGCSKKEAQNSQDDLKVKIVGKWKYMKNEIHSVVSGTSETEIENDQPGNFFQFNDDYTFTAKLDDGPGTGAWKLKDSKIGISLSDASEWDSIMWSIKELSDNTLILYYKRVLGSDLYELTIFLSR